MPLIHVEHTIAHPNLWTRMLERAEVGSQLPFRNGTFTFRLELTQKPVTDVLVGKAVGVSSRTTDLPPIHNGQEITVWYEEPAENCVGGWQMMVES